MVIQKEFDRQCNKMESDEGFVDIHKCIDDIEKYKLSKNIRGTPLWYKSKLHDLQAIVYRHGLPTLLLTLTVDDVSQTRWPEYDALDDFLEEINPNLQSKSAPCETSLLFHHRHENFLNRFILDPHGPKLLGRVLRHTIRYETQNRQAWHSHVLLWIHPDDIDRISQLLTMEIPYDITKTGELVPPADPLMRKLHDIIVSKMQHQCVDGMCRHNGKCKYGFPYPVQMDHTPKLDPITGRNLPYCPGEEHRNTACYVPMITLLWGAHSNVVLITQAAFSHYLLKYTMKCEPAGRLNISADTLHTLGITEASPVVHRILSEVIHCRPVSLNEAVMEMLDIDIITFSDDVQFYNTAPPGERVAFEKVVTRKGKDAFNLDFVSMYCSRPTDLDDLTFVAFYENYTWTPLTKQKKGSLSHGNEVPFITSNKQLTRRKKPIVVRLPRYHPSGDNPEGYFYNILMQRVPFRNENTLLGSGGTYYSRCVDMHICDTEEKLFNLVESYHIMVNSKDYNLDQDCDTILEHYAMTISVEHNTPVYNEPDEYLQIDDCIASLTEDQKNAYKQIIEKPYGFHVLQGGPGCGKSYLINLIHKTFHSHGKNVVLCASTAVAAVNIHGKTLDSVVSLERIGPKRTTINIRKKSYNYCKHADVFIIDEAFMLTALKLDVCLKRIFSCRDEDIDQQVSEKLFILVGDRNQLPPMCDHSNIRGANNLLDTCTICCIMNSEFSRYQWNIMDLTTSCRYKSDPEWGQFIDKIIRTKVPPSEQEIRNMFEHRIINDTEYVDFLIDNPGAISIHTRNDHAIALGEQVLIKQCELTNRAVFDVSPVYRMTYGSPPFSTSVIASVEKSFQAAERQIKCLTKIAVGMDVVFTHNQNFAKGIINGAMGTVVAVAYKNMYDKRRLTNADYTTIPMVHGDKVPWAIKLTVNSAANIVTLYAREKECYVRSGSCYKIRYFPIIPASSFTAHKVQGKTILEKVLLDIRDIFQQGQLIVMLSRVASVKQLSLTSMPTPEMFQVSQSDEQDAY